MAETPIDGAGPGAPGGPDEQAQGEGVIGGAEIVLPAGTYRIETAGPSPRAIEDVVIKPRELTKAIF